MAVHSSIHVWRILWVGEPGELRSMGLQRVGQDLVTKQQQPCGRQDALGIQLRVRDKSPVFRALTMSWGSQTVNK